MKGLKRLQKRALALFMALVLCLGLLPATALAEALEPEWQELTSVEIQNLLGKDSASFTASDLVGKSIEGKGEIKQLGMSAEDNIQPVNAETKFALSEEGITLAPDEEEKEPVIRTVTWYAEDGETVLEQATYTEGEDEPVYPGETPAKDEDETNTYQFKEWEKAEDEAGNISYTATFNAIPKMPAENEKILSDDESEQENAVAPQPSAEDAEEEEEEDSSEEDFTQIPGETAGEEEPEIETTDYAAIDESAAPENVQTVTLWAVFETEKEKISDDETVPDDFDGMIQVLLNRAELKSETVDMIPGKDVDMVINVKFPSEEAAKKLVVVLPQGMRLSNGSTVDQDEGNSRIKSINFSRDTTAAYGGYDTLAGTVTCVFQENTTLSGISLKVRMDQPFWNRQKGSGPAEPVQITTITGTGDSETVYGIRHIAVIAAEESEESIYINTNNSNRTITGSAKTAFTLASNHSSENIVRWRGETCYKRIVIRVDIPYVEINGEKVYAEAITPLSFTAPIKDNIKKYMSQELVTAPDGTPVQVVYTFTDWYAPFYTGLTPCFQWPESVPAGLVVHTGKTEATATYFTYNEEETEYQISTTVQDPEDATIKTLSGEAFQIHRIENADHPRYNWYNENPYLTYGAGCFHVSNSGPDATVAKTLIYKYSDSDLFGIYEQRIPAYRGSKVTVTYKTTDESRGEVTKIFATDANNVNATTIIVDATSEGLKPGEYFTEIRATPDLGYPSGFSTWDGTKFQLKRDLRDGENISGIVCSDFVTLTIMNADGTPSPDKFGENTLRTQAIRSMTVHKNLEKTDCYVSAKISTVGELQVGSQGTLRAVIGTAGRTWKYLPDPIVYLRLPKGITLGSEEDIGAQITCSNVDGKTYILQPGDYRLEKKTAEDGATVCGIRFLNHRGGVGNENLCTLTIDFTVSISLSFEGESLNCQDLLFVSSENWLPRVNGAKTDEDHSIDFIRTDTGTLGTAATGTIPVKPAVKGILFYSGNDPFEDGTMGDIVLDENNIDDTITASFGVWNNTGAEQNTHDSGMETFVTYIFLPRKNAKLPNMATPNGFDLFLTGAAVNKDGHQFLTIDYCAENYPTTYNNPKNWIAEAEKWANAVSWINEDTIKDWREVTALRVKINRSAPETIASKGTKGFSLTLEASDDLAVGSSVRFSGIGKTAGTDGGNVLSEWTISGNPIRSSAQGVIRGRVYVDANHNGAYDEGEGKENVTVTLTQPTFERTVVPTAITKDGGVYEFRGLTDGGPYTVAVANPDAEKYYFVDDESAKAVTFAAGKIVAGEDFALEEYQEVTFKVTGDPKTYTVTDAEPQRVRYNAQVTAWPKVMPVIGYQAGSWTPAQSTPIIQDTEFTIAVGDHLSKYTVEHYKQELAGTGYGQPETETVETRVGDPVTAQAKTYEGFTWDESAEGTSTEGTVKGDGSLVLRLYYTRNEYQVKYEYTGEVPAGASEKPEEKMYRYGEDVQVQAATAPVGYTFNGWTRDGESAGTSFTMPAGDVLLTGSFRPESGVAYTMEHYRENLAGDGYEEPEKETLYSETGTAVTAQAKTYEGFTWDESAEGTLTEGTVKGDGSLVLRLYYTRNEYQVKYEYTGEVPAGASALPEAASYKYGAPVSVSASASAADYTFSGWKMDGKDAADFTMPAKDVTISGSFSRNTPNGGGGGGTIDFPDPTPAPRPTPVPDEPTPMDPGTNIDDEATPLAGAIGLNDVDHFAYIVGYDDGTVRPTNNITRAEVATIFFRLMEDDYRAANWSMENSFSDVSAGQWYNNAISTCEKAGALTGYSDGSFKPENPITRAEFAVIASRFLSEEYTDEGVGDFSDTANHWAAKEIRRAVKAGWITGDGNRFRPEDPITRAEVMTIVNRMLDRLPDAEHFLPDMIQWVDNPKGTWYYEAVQEATNEHDYERDELNAEIWTLIKPHRDWSALEKQWADAYAG